MVDRHRLAVVALVALSATLAVHSLLQDSATFDETDHLVSGFSYLKTGDLRLAPDHPPLARVWAALPLWLSGVAFEPEPGAWRRGDFWALGRSWLFVQNTPDALLMPARLMMVALLLCLELVVYAAARLAFGREAGLLALFCAALDPGLLAHGRLVTTDIPICLGLMAGLLVLARALARLDARRVVACVVVWTLLPLTKMSWPLVLPATGVMLGAFVFGGGRGLAVRRAAQAGGLALVIAGTSLLAIWTAYGWRYSTFRDADPSATFLLPSGVPEPDMRATWERVLSDAAGQPLRGPLVAFVRFARERELLPEPYLYGLAYTQGAMERRTGYFRGEHSRDGSPLYFPTLLATKTPLALLLVMLAGVARAGPEWRRGSDAGRLLMVGLVGLVVTLLLAAVLSPMNIGHRHVLPLEPPLLVLAGAAAGWAGRVRARLRFGLLLVPAWLAATTLAAHPHYLSYFNETIGGPARAHRWFADSNLDWGQDLKRLAAEQRQHAGEPLYLAYFGSALPEAYGVRARPLNSYFAFGEPSELGPGTYVVSLNQLLGVYEPFARDEFWSRPETREDYRLLLEAGGSGAADPGLRLRLRRARGGRLLQQLREREPDARIGGSLFVYRLAADELARLTQPPG